MLIEALESRRLCSVGHHGQKLVLDDSFNTLNTTTWNVSGSWIQGRSDMNASNGVVVKDGVANLAVSTFDPTHPGSLVTGSELDSTTSYSLGQNGAKGFRYVVRAKFSSLQRGLVGGIFTYSQNPDVSHDELDCEALSNQGALAGSKTIDANIFRTDGSVSYRPMRLPRNFSFTKWHTYEIRWTTGGTKWLIDNKLMRASTYVARSPMIPIINFWAADASWTSAYSADLKPVTDQGQAQTSTLQIDRVQVWALT